MSGVDHLPHRIQRGFGDRLGERRMRMDRQIDFLDRMPASQYWIPHNAIDGETRRRRGAIDTSKRRFKQAVDFTLKT